MKKSPISYLHRHAHAFTLIEILVVVGIIGTLAALSFSMLSGTTAKAKDVACLSNMRQLGIGTQLYVAENQAYPAGTFYSGPYRHWTDAVQPYLGKDGVRGADGLTKIFDCPAKTVSTAQPEMAYTANPNVMLDLASRRNVPPLPMMQVQRPSSTILLADACQLNAKGYVKPFMFSQPGIYDRSESKANQPVPVGTDKDGVNFAGIRYRHAKDTAANFLFADGHAQSMKKGELLHKHLQIRY